MKEKLKRAAGICKIIFGYGIMLSLLVGSLTFLGYIIALIAGGDTAVLICDFLYNKVLKLLIYITNILIVFGLLSMYLAGEKSLMPTTKHKEHIKRARKK